MAAKNAADVTAKWSARMRSPETAKAIKDGVQNISVNPMEEAIKQADAYVSGVQEAVASGKWQDGLRRTTLSDWQSLTAGKGVQNLSTGVKAAESKVQAFQTQWLPYVETGKQMVRAMPKTTEAERDARQSAMTQYLRRFKRSNSRF